MNNYIDFFHDIFEKESGVPDIYQRISHIENTDVLYEVDYNKNYNKENLYCLKYVPDYMELSLKESHLFNVKSVKDVKGFSVNLKNHENIDEYLLSQFKTKPRSAIRKYIRRLESSFNIGYKMYYGEIEESHYEFLMKSLRGMLNRRWEQRKGIDINRNRWSEVCKLILKLLQKKKASLFVVYNDDVPIAITANYHFNDKIFFYGIPAYDIDYSIFRLGHVVIYKELDWCFNNKYTVFDTGRGDYEYKRKWCNYIYNFDYQYVYKANSILALMSYKQEYLKLGIKNYLKKNKIALSVYKLVMSLKNRKTSIELKNTFDYSLTKVDSFGAFDNLKIIDFTAEKYVKIRKPIIDFLYLNVAHVSEIKVFEVAEEKKYLIKGKSKLQLITLK